MLTDMTPEDTHGDDYREESLTYYDKHVRKVLITEREEPFPLGNLIVSRTDKKGVITHANQAFVDMSGWTQAELIGTPHYILRHPDMPAAAFKDLWDTLARGDKWHGYVKNLRKDGAFYWVYATVIANIRNGDIVGYTSVRRKPSRDRVKECIDLYAKMLAEETRASPAQS